MFGKLFLISNSVDHIKNTNETHSVWNPKKRRHWDRGKIFTNGAAGRRIDCIVITVH